MDKATADSRGLLRIIGPNNSGSFAWIQTVRDWEPRSLICVWYRKRVKIPTEWKADQILIHFQAVDYESTVWAMVRSGSHRGGFTPFSCTVDLSNLTADREMEIVLRARDYDDLLQLRETSTRLCGPWCFVRKNYWYLETVWMEPVPQIHLQRPRLTPVGSTESFGLYSLWASQPRTSGSFQNPCRWERGYFQGFETNADFTLKQIFH